MPQFENAIFYIPGDGLVIISFNLANGNSSNFHVYLFSH